MGDIIGGVASIFSGIAGASAAKKASAQQAAAFNNALDFQKQVYGNTQANLQPFIGAGTSALPSLLGFYGLPGGNASGATQAFSQFQSTPFYQFPLQQAQLGVNRQLASSGLIGSGAALRDASQLSAGYASQGLNSYLSGLSGLAGSGQNAASSLGGLGNTASQTMLQGYTGLGNAQAAGTIGAYNSLWGGIMNAMPAFGNLFGGPGGLGGSSYSGGGFGGPFGGTQAYQGQSGGTYPGGGGVPAPVGALTAGSGF